MADAEAAVAAQLVGQPLQEAGVILARRRGPAGLGHRRQPRPGVVFDPGETAGVAGPHVRLQAQDVVTARLLQFGGHRLEGVEGFHRVELRPPGRFVGRGGLQIVQVQRRHRRHHHVAPLPRRLQAAFGAAPGHHRGLRRQPAFQNLVPADQLLSVAGQDRLQPAHEPALQRGLVGDAQFAHARLHPRRGLPLVLDRLVGADVDPRRREQRGHFGEHLVEEGEGVLFDVEQVGMDAALVGDRDRPAFHPELRIGGDGGGGMAGHVDLRQHLDVALGGIGDDVGDLLLAVVAAVGTRQSAGRIEAGIAAGDAAAAHFGQARVLLDFDAPALVVGQVPVEEVELVQRHRVEHALDLVHAVEVPGRIEHVAAPAKARRVLDPQRGQVEIAAGSAGGGLDQLPQRERTVIQAGRVAGDHRDALGIDGQAIALGGDAGVRIEGEVDPRCRRGEGVGSR